MHDTLNDPFTNIALHHSEGVHMPMPPIFKSLWEQASGVPWPQAKTLNIAVKQTVGNAPKLPYARNVVAILSGKGGVGKSTISASLARLWAQGGAKVGLLDADIQGPSLPLLFPIAHTIEASSPLTACLSNDVWCMSMGYVVAQQQALAWRGPMVSTAFKQLCYDTIWPVPLDYLIIDMPPGTGDVTLTLCQQLPVTASVVVSLGDALSWSDALRAVTLLEKLKVPILGWVHNQAYHHCEACGHRTMLFLPECANTTLPCLGTLPFLPQFMAQWPTQPLSTEWYHMAHHVACQWFTLPNDTPSKTLRVKTL
jgi:Mrp family chromosome partitioning ATPase